MTKNSNEGDVMFTYIGEYDSKITFEMNMLYMTSSEFIDKVKSFMLAIGYLPTSINNGLNDNIDDVIEK